MIDNGATVGGESECGCRFEDCKRPKSLFGQALDGRIVVYPLDSEEARLDERVLELTQWWVACRSMDCVTKCPECKEEFHTVYISQHVRAEEEKLAIRQKELLSERQKLLGKFLC
jgi:hypothetical protein